MNSSAIKFHLVALGAGMSSALSIPTLSVFLATELQLQSWKIGTLFSANALSGIVISILIAHFSDRLKSRKHLLLFCISMQICNALLFIFCRRYVVMIAFGALLSAFGSAAVPQLFALAKQTYDNAQFSAVLRAQFSLAWVFGPPLGYWLIQQFGFITLYIVITGVLLFVFLMSTRLPSNPYRPSRAINLPEHSQSMGRNLSYLVVSTILIWTSSALYLIAFPLYLEYQPSLSSDWTGVLYGVAAALEIPVMLLGARFLCRVSKKYQMQVAILCGIIFYAGVIYSRGFDSLLVLQIFNAIFIGLTSIVGLSWFQELLKNQQGLAATLYTNSVSVGVFFAGVMQSLLSYTKSLYTWPTLCLLLAVSYIYIVKIDEI